MRPETLYLTDILEAAGAIQRYCDGVSFTEFLQDDMRQSAVLQKLIVIGEAASRLPIPFKENHPDIPWKDIVAFRNIAVHEYFAIMWEIVWTTATQEVPDLNQQIVELIQSQS